MAEDFDVDALVESIEGGGNSEIPMASEGVQAEAEAPSQEVQQQAAPQQQAPEFEFSARGQAIKIKPDDPRFQQWLSQGYDYAQRMQEFNKKQLEVGEFQKQFDAWKQRYAPIDDYAKQNPAWWEHVEKTWTERDKFLQQNKDNPLLGELQTLKQELAAIKDFKTQIVQKETEAAIKAADSALATDIEEMQKEFPSIDLRSVDETGKTLETRVLEYAQQKGISDFRSAYLAFNHKALTQLAMDKAKEELSKSQVKAKQAGLLGKVPAPAASIADLRDIKTKSYDDIHREILSELGIH